MSMVYLPFKSNEIKEAIDKQTPQKPLEVTALRHTAWGLCPRCKGGPISSGKLSPNVVFNRWAYCPDCGQALDWSVWEERMP